MSLSSPRRPLCVIGRLGTKKKKALVAQWKGGKEGSEAPAFSLFRLSPERFLLFDYWDGNLCGGESCYVPTLYMCNDRSVMVNFKPGDYLPE